jgi:regulator of RNase E activity RraA
VIVRPGDWVIGDEDGIVVVPAERLEATLANASQLAEVEAMIEAEVAKGRDLAELLRYHEVFDAKTKDGMLPQLRFLKR